MITTLRRLLWLALLGGATYAGYTAWQRRQEPRLEGPATWPPLDDAPAQPPVAADAAGVTGFAPDAGGVPEHRSWRPPVDGACPDGYPIKGNENSGIFHVPGGRFYERTVPERCYANEADAEADGFRRAKA